MQKNAIHSFARQGLFFIYDLRLTISDLKWQIEMPENIAAGSIT
jgi:hypothetical protein